MYSQLLSNFFHLGLQAGINVILTNIPYIIKHAVLQLPAFENLLCVCTLLENQEIHCVALLCFFSWFNAASRFSHTRLQTDRRWINTRGFQNGLHQDTRPGILNI